MSEQEPRGPRRRRIRIAGAAAATALTAGVAVLATHRWLGGEVESAAAAYGRYGWYRAEMELVAADGGEGVLPFYLYLPASGEQALLLNDREEIPLAHRWAGDRLTASLSHYSWTIDAGLVESPDRGATLAGRLTASHPVYQNDLLPGEDQLTMTVRARRVARPDPDARFQLPAPAAAPPASFSGSWRITPEVPVDGASEGRKVVYKAVLEQRGAEVRGDVILDTGDLRFMGGNARGGALGIGALDGSHFALMTARLDDRDHMSGELFLLRRRTRFVAERAELSGPELQRQLTAVDVAGWRPAALERHRGKPLIVEIFGTWCSNCNDSIALVRELYERHHAAGLEVVGFSVEMTDDAAYARDLLERFRDRHQVPWDLVTITDEDELEALMQPFQGAYAVPILLFLRRDGSVAGVHTGYIGPNAPADHRALRAELERLAADIAASPPPR